MGLDFIWRDNEVSDGNAIDGLLEEANPESFMISFPF